MHGQCIKLYCNLFVKVVDKCTLELTIYTLNCVDAWTQIIPKFEFGLYQINFE